MKIAFTAKGTDWEAQIDPRFGRTDFLLIYNEENDTLSHVDNRDIESIGHGAGTKTSGLLYDLNPNVLITGNGPGNNAAVALKQLSLKIYIGAGGMSVKQAYNAYKNKELREY